jgi:hypothetical protein
MTLAVIGGARNLASVLRGDTALRAKPDAAECNPYQRRQIKLASAHRLLLYWIGSLGFDAFEKEGGRHSNRFGQIIRSDTI